MCTCKMAQSQSQTHTQEPQSQPKKPDEPKKPHTRIKMTDWYEMHDNLKRLNEERKEHWKQQDAQYAKIESIQTKIKDLNNQLNYEMKLLRTILDKSPALYGLK